MTRPIRLRLSRAKGFDLQLLSRSTNGLPARSVARPGPFGNPWTVAGARRAGFHGTDAELREMCVAFFRNGERGGLPALNGMKERFAMVQVHGVPHVITDIGMRMLHWRELAAAQGLPADYRWTGPDGEHLGKTKIIRLIGNSVSPPPATALLRALLGGAQMERKAA